MTLARRLPLALTTMLSLATASSLAHGFEGAAVASCDGFDNIALLAANVRDLDGDDADDGDGTGLSVRVAVVDTGGEPACCSSHALIYTVIDDGSEGIETCSRVAMASDEKLGFAEIAIEAVQIERREANAFLGVPVKLLVGDEGVAYQFVNLVIDGGTGQVSLAP